MITKDTEEAIIKYLEYRDGKLYWKNRTGTATGINGKEAGGPHTYGYRRIRINYTLLKTHRVIFFMHHGYWPKYIDHINRVTDDNRIENLRECTQAENARNSYQPNELGRNISFHKSTNKYRVHLMVNYKQLHFGLFENLEDAKEAAKKARKQHFGEFNYDY